MYYKSITILMLLSWTSFSFAQKKPEKIKFTELILPQPGFEIPDYKLQNTESLNLQTVDPIVIEAQERAKMSQKIGLLHAPGHEPPERHKSVGPDTANFKPENFSFPSIDRKTLTDRLESDVPRSAPDCKPAWGLFVFRVNARGKVDSTWYQGNLIPDASNKILSNICATEGRWIIKPGTKPEDIAWFAYPYINTRGEYDKQLNCSEAEKGFLKAISYLGSLFFNLYYQVDRNHNRATMLMPTKIDDNAKL